MLYWVGISNGLGFANLRLIFFLLSVNLLSKTLSQRIAPSTKIKRALNRAYAIMVAFKFALEQGCTTGGPPSCVMRLLSTRISQSGTKS